MNFVYVEKQERAKRGEGTRKNHALVSMVNGKKFVFNLKAKELLGLSEADNKFNILCDQARGLIGFEKNPEGKYIVRIGDRTLIIKANLTKNIEEKYRKGRFQTTIAYSEEYEFYLMDLNTAKEIIYKPRKNSKVVSKAYEPQ